MRTIFSATIALVLFCANALAGGAERPAMYTLIEEIAAVNPMGAAAARELFVCGIEQAKRVGEADKVTPASLVRETMAKDALARCSRESSWAAIAFTAKQAEAVTAQMLKVAGEAAIAVRRVEVIVCAHLHPCGTPLKR